jgi:hypothetical protein
MNPLFSDIPPTLLSEIGPSMAVAWLVAGIMMRARAPAKSVGTFVPLKTEQSEVEASMASGAARPPEATTVRIRVELARGCDIEMLCERLGMMDDRWTHITAWTQLTTYDYMNPFVRDIGELKAGPHEPFRVFTTAKPTPLGMVVSHEERIGGVRIPFVRVPDPSPMRFVRHPRRAWSRKEDVANLLSDLWVLERRGDWQGSCDEGTGSVNGDVLARFGCHDSEMWMNHVRMLDDLVSAAERGNRSSGGEVVLETWASRPVIKEMLPSVVTSSRVNHRMEKTFRNDHILLTVSIESEGSGFQQAERGLWHAAGKAQREQQGAAGRAWITLEPASFVQWAGEPDVSPLLQAAALVRQLTVLDLLTVEDGDVLAPLGVDDARRLWSCSFLARGCRTPESLVAQIPSARAALDQIQSGRLCATFVDLFAEWGIFYGDPGSGQLFPQKPYSTSGSMPRLYRPSEERSYKFVVRPKLFVSDEPSATWGGEQECAEKNCSAPEVPC